jgi:hypothetical protein
LVRPCISTFFNSSNGLELCNDRFITLIELVSAFIKKLGIEKRTVIHNSIGNTAACSGNCRLNHATAGDLTLIAVIPWLPCYCSDSKRMFGNTDLAAVQLVDLS